MPAPPLADPRTEFAYTVASSTTDTNKRNSLAGEGNVAVDGAHWFYSVMGHVLPPVASGRGTVSIRLVHYVVEADLLYEDAVRALCPSFTLRTTFLSILWAAAASTGVDFSRVSASTLELAGFQARKQFRAIVRNLSSAARTVAINCSNSSAAASRRGCVAVSCNVGFSHNTIVGFFVGH